MHSFRSPSGATLLSSDIEHHLQTLMLLQVQIFTSLIPTTGLFLSLSTDPEIFGDLSLSQTKRIKYVKLPSNRALIKALTFFIYGFVLIK